MRFHRLASGLLVLAALLAGTPTVSAQAAPSTDFAAPDDVAAVPEDADRTASGLAWRRLSEAGARVERPGILDMVEVRYTGWTTDGVMFDSTEFDGTPRKFRVDGVIPGFEQAVQLLSVGERGRFWVPEDLAYSGAEGKPAGMLVFDLTLVGMTRGPRRPAKLDAPPEHAVRKDSGLAWVVLKEGPSGQESPGEEATVVVEYSTWSTDGRLLDSTLHRGQPRSLTMNLIIEGFRETFSSMVPGERRLIWMPSALTEFEGHKSPEETVVFDLEMLSFMSPPKAPPSVSAIPADAETSLTGLAWRVLKPGNGDVHPRSGDAVEVLYSMWTRDGKLVDSSYAHAGPGRFELNSSMPFGFNEALFDMVVGEKRLIWIPEDLAYAGQKGRPEGMLVFEVELSSIEPASP